MRAFVAINLPDHERVRLHASLAPLRALSLPVRWLPPESLHITLKFLGKIDEAQAVRVEQVLGDIAAGTPAFDIDADGVGAFPNLTRPRVWWVGVREHTGLVRAQSALETALASVGHGREERQFSPHITIGRTKAVLRRLPRTAHEIVHEVYYNAHIHVSSFDLMESHLTADGARYTRRHAAQLLPAATSAAVHRRGATAPTNPRDAADAERLPPAARGRDGGGRPRHSDTPTAARENVRMG